MENNYGDGLYKDGVFYFTNTSKEDYKHLWNNIEYTFPAESSTPMIIRNEPPENVQAIRKRFAYDWAVEQFHNGKEYLKLSKMGNGLPPTYDEKILEPFIEKCLNPLPMGQIKTKEMPKEDEKKFKGSKALKDNVSVNAQFKEDEE